MRFFKKQILYYPKFYQSSMNEFSQLVASNSVTILVIVYIKGESKLEMRFHTSVFS